MCSFILLKSDPASPESPVSASRLMQMMQSYKRISTLSRPLGCVRVCVFQINFTRQAEDAALICPWKEPCFSWLKIYFYILNEQVKVIFLTGKMLSCDCPCIFFFFSPLSPLSCPVDTCLLILLRPHICLITASNWTASTFSPCPLCTFFDSSPVECGFWLWICSQALTT